MKPFIAGGAGDRPRDAGDHDPDRARLPDRSAATISDSHPHGIADGRAGDPEVQQRRHRQDRDADAAAGDVGDVHAIGFGQKPQIAFPGAVSGRLRPYKTWRPIEQATMCYGYGLSVSLFQLARAYTVFARDGQLMPVTLLKDDEPAAGVRVFSPKTAQRGAQHAAAGRWAGRHRAEGADAWATRWAARPAPRTSRRARATPPTSTAPGSSAWRRSATRASWWR